MVFEQHSSNSRIVKYSGTKTEKFDNYYQLWFKADQTMQLISISFDVRAAVPFSRVRRRKFRDESINSTRSASVETPTSVIASFRFYSRSRLPPLPLETFIAAQNFEEFDTTSTTMMHSVAFAGNPFRIAIFPGTTPSATPRSYCYL